MGLLALNRRDSPSHFQAVAQGTDLKGMQRFAIHVNERSSKTSIRLPEDLLPRWNGRFSSSNELSVSDCRHCYWSTGLHIREEAVAEIRTTLRSTVFLALCLAGGKRLMAKASTRDEADRLVQRYDLDDLILSPVLSLLDIAIVSGDTPKATLLHGIDVPQLYRFWLADFLDPFNTGPREPLRQRTNCANRCFAVCVCMTSYLAGQLLTDRTPCRLCSSSRVPVKLLERTVETFSSASGP